MDFQKVSRLIAESEFLRPSVLLFFGTLVLLLIARTPFSAKSALVIALSLLLFAAGERLGRLFKPTLTFANKEKIYYFGASLILASLLALYLNFFSAGGAPLFNSAIRRFLSAPLTYTSFLIVPGIIFAIVSFDAQKTKNAKLKAFGLIFFAAAMMALLGFRTEVLAAILGGAFAAYYSRIFSLRELGALLLLGLVAFLGVSAIRNAEAASGRAATTVSNFNALVDYAPVGGLTNGYVQFADFHKLLSRTPIYSGRVLLSSVIGGRVSSSSTATIFAPPFVDFGLLGLAMFLFFGAVLGAGYKAAKETGSIYAATHSLLVTFLILSIETGIVDLIVWVYFVFITVFYAVAHRY